MTNHKQSSNPTISNTNAVMVLGCLAREPEYDTSRDYMMAKFVLAGQMQVAEDGDAREVTFYEPIILRGKRAERFRDLGLNAGDAVLATGLWRTRGEEQARRLEIDYTHVAAAVGYEDHLVTPRSTDGTGALRMASGETSTQIYGTLIADAQYITMQSGKGLLNFVVAVRTSWKDGHEWFSETAFVRVNCWGAMADRLVALGMAKGRDVYVDGMVKRGSYQTESGEKRYTVEVVAKKVSVGAGLKKLVGADPFLDFSFN